MKKRVIVVTCLLILSACIVVPFAKLGGPGFGGIGGSILPSTDVREATIPGPGGFNHAASPFKLGGPGFGGIGDASNILINELSFTPSVHTQRSQLLSTRFSRTHLRTRKQLPGINVTSYYN